MNENNLGFDVNVKSGKTEHPDKTWEEVQEMARKFNEEQARLYEERMLKEQQDNEEIEVVEETKEEETIKE